MKDWTISEIEKITEAEANEMAIEKMVIKGHNVYFVSLVDTFGYSCLIFKDNHHIYYANDYQLHHGNKTVDELKQFYIKNINGILFTEDEIAAPLKDYGEFHRKEYFLRNYYCMRVDNVSIFSSESKENFSKRTKDMFFDRYGLCYVKEKSFVDHHAELMNNLYNAQDKLRDSYQYWEDAFLREMYNHEYGINWQADYDTLSVFGNIRYQDDDNLEGYFCQLKFNDVQRKAYIGAKKKYFKAEAGNL